MPEDKEQEILIDKVIELTDENTHRNYPKKLRRISLYDKEKNRALEFITNNFI